MSLIWRQRCRSLSSNRNLKTGWLVVAGIGALYVSAIRPYQASRGIANSRSSGLSVDKAEPVALWQQQSRALPRYRAALGRDESGENAKGVVGGTPINQATSLHQMSFLSSPPPLPDAESDRKIVRTSVLDLVVKKPEQTADRIRVLAESMDGFLVSSEIRGDIDVSGGILTLRVPAARFEEARTAIRKMGIRVENEKIQADDVTRQYVDQAANLRNLRAAEEQYLSILKQAKTVKDTLEVSEKLNDVRGQIEQQQAEFEALSKQIETVAITVSLRTEAEARVLGLNWRPLYQMKLALRDGLDGLATYASSMIAFAFFLPTIVLWLVTFALGSLLVWRVLRWVGRRWFGWKVRERVPAQA